MPQHPGIPSDVIRRLGAETTAIRLAREAHLSAIKRGDGIHAWRLLFVPRPLVRLGLRVTGLADRAYREYLDVRVEENPVVLRGLPAAFEGFRLLQVTDLHCDLDSALIDHVISALDGLPFDLCVVTGDYHDLIGQPWEQSLDLMRRLIPHLGKDPVGILGNHDFLAKVGPLESAGLRMLLNEHVAIERDGERLWICGIDDPHSFRTHDLAKAATGIPADDGKILLSHSPEPWREAAAAGFALFLTGHTHGGQICLPGGFPLVRRASVPRPLLSGRWREGEMQGYTSRGTGGCSVRARLNCPAEVTVHILRRA